MVNPLSLDHFWVSRRKFEEAERIFYEAKYGGNGQIKSLDSKSGRVSDGQSKCKVTVEIDKVRHYITNSLSISNKTLVFNERYNKLIKEKSNLNKTINDLKKSISKLELRINTLEKSSGPVKVPEVKKAVAVKKDEDDDDIDLFGSDDEDDAEAEKIREERAQAAATKKQKKGVIAKSSVILDIKPWDDETDMVALEKSVREIDQDGLLWGASKLVPVAFGVKKLQIVCVVEDDKVSIDELSEKIEAIEDYVQSVDVAAFAKI